MSSGSRPRAAISREAAGAQAVEVDEEADHAEGRGPLRVGPHEVEDGLVGHAAERDVLDREALGLGAQALAELSQRGAAEPLRRRSRRGRRRSGCRCEPASRRAVEEHLPVVAVRHPLVPEEEAVDVEVLPDSGGQHVVDAFQVVLLDFTMADRLDGPEHAGPEQLAGARREGRHRPLADLAHDHVGADPLQRRGPAFEVDTSDGGGDDGDEARDQQALRREPARARQRQRPARAGVRRRGAGPSATGEPRASGSKERSMGSGRRTGSRDAGRTPP